jgi:hypothetical protein
MPNWLNDVVEGVGKIGLGVESGLLERGERKEAQSLYEKGQTYITEMTKQREQALKDAEQISNTGKPIDPTTQTEQTEQPQQEMGIDQVYKPYEQLPVDPKVADKLKFNDGTPSVTGKPTEYSLSGLYEILGKLGQNTYGKELATNLKGLYESNLPDYDVSYDKDRGLAITTDKKTGKIVKVEKYGEEKKKEGKYKSIIDYNAVELDTLQKNPAELDKVSYNDFLSNYEDLPQWLRDYADQKYPNIKDIYAKLQAEEDSKKSFRRSGLRRGGLKTPDFDSNEANLNSLLNKYSVAEFNGEDTSEYENTLIKRGFGNPQALLQEYNASKKKGGKFSATEKIRESQENYESVKATESKIGLDRWQKDLENAVSYEDFKGKLDYYMKIMEDKYLPQMSTETGNVVWGDFYSMITTLNDMWVERFNK